MRGARRQTAQSLRAPLGWCRRCAIHQRRQLEMPRLHGAKLSGAVHALALVMAFQKILCPIDFSPYSQDAMRVAVRLAGEADAELVLAHVWHMPPAGEYPLPPDAVRDMTGQAERGLGEAATEATQLGAKRVSVSLS